MNTIKIFFLKHWKALGKLILAGVILFLILRGGREHFREINFYEITITIRSLGPDNIVTLLIFGLAATAIMTLYDYAIIKYFNHTIRPLLFFNISFVANSLNNLLGMGGLAGATARTILLRKNSLDFNMSVYYNVLLAPATPTGLSLLGLCFLIWPGATEPLFRQYPWLYLGLAGVILILPAYFLLNSLIDHFQKKDAPLQLHRSVSLKFRLVLISLAEWLAAFAFFFYLVRMYAPDADAWMLLGIYTISAIAGIMSFLPGGIGSFDLIALFGLQAVGLDTTKAATALVLFRIFMFLIPAFLGIFSLIINLTMEQNEKLFSYSYITNVGFFNNVMKYYKTFSDFINVLLAILVFSGGIVLLTSAIKPGIQERIELIAAFLPMAVLNFLQIASIVTGFMLCFLSFEVLYKVKRAYSLGVWLLAAGGIFTFLKGLDFEEAIFIMIVIALLRFSKPSFYRYSIPVRMTKLLLFSALGFAGILFYFTVGERIHVEFIQHNLYPEKLMSVHGDILYHSLLTYACISVFLMILYTKKPIIESDPKFESPDYERLTEFLEHHAGGALTHLLYLGDKNFFWAADGAVVIPYKKHNEMIVVLGDPIGSPEFLSGAITEFQEFLDRYGYEAIFYEVSDRYLSTYHENGYYFFKLGEEAIVDLERFRLSGSSKSNLRHTVNSFRKKGYVFKVLDPPFDASFFAECREISDEWLKERSEMGFSMGWYDEAYLQRSQIAVLRDLEGSMLAFVSLMPSYDQNQSMSTDLMRLRSSVPHGTMDFLLLSMIEYLQEHGFRYFNLGMAPLSNVGTTPYSHFREKIAHFAFRFGKFFYSFEGLRKYKEKYEPIWKPRYLAYPQLISLPATILEISMMISADRKKSSGFPAGKRKRRSLLKLSMMLALILLMMVQAAFVFGQQPFLQIVDSSKGPAFPRLGMWWLDPYTASEKDIARYDLLLNEFEGDGLKGKLERVRKINPSIKVFRPMSPSERCLFLEWDGEKIPNPEIKNLPTSFFLIQKGSYLKNAVGKKETKLAVKELYYDNGTPIFHVGGDAALGTGESVHVTEIDEKMKILTVERGYVRSAAAHKSGEYIAPHIRFWPGSWVMNVTTDCPKVRLRGIAKPVNWIGYYDQLSQGTAAGIYPDLSSNGNYIDQTNLNYDGFIIDRFEDFESWLIWTEDGQEAEIDLKHDGNSAAPEAIDESWRKGTDQLLSLLRRHYSGLPIIRNNPLTTRYSLYDGQVYETGGWSNPSEEWWNDLFIKTNSDDYYISGCYSDWFHAKKAPFVMLEVYEDESGEEADGDGTYENPFKKESFTPNYRRMRFSLASALLGDGYYSYEINTNGHGSLGLMWFDEYDNCGKGKGYLGWPMGEKEKLSNGAYLRTFDNGIVLVNPQDHAVTIKLNRTYTKIKGKQVPGVNDGKKTNTVSLQSFDGLILLN